MIQRLVESEDVNLETAQTNIISMVLDVARYMLPSVLITPFSNWIIRRYTLRWRISLMKTYTQTWEQTDLCYLEGVSQRVQEDTQKFAAGVQLVFREIISAIFALIVFGPFLVRLGSRIQPPKRKATRPFHATLRPHYPTTPRLPLPHHITSRPTQHRLTHTGPHRATQHCHAMLHVALRHATLPNAGSC